MTRLDLRILRGPHDAALAIGHSIPAVRVLASISIGALGGWPPFSTAIVDTGAPLCMFPSRLWRGAEYETLGKIAIGGIVGRPECRVPALLARVNLLISDGVRACGPYSIVACLAESGEVPTLLGVAGVLERGSLSVELRHDQASIELPEP